MKKNLIIFMICALTALTGAERAIAPVKPGERLAFLGDSITRQGGYLYAVQQYLALRHPELGATVINLGIAGNKSSDALERFDLDLPPNKPDRVFVMFGMNDVNMNNYRSATADSAVMAKRREALNSYRDNMTRLIALLKKNNYDIVLMTPTPYDQYGTVSTKEKLFANAPGGLTECARIVKELAVAESLPVIDLHSFGTTILQQHPDSDFGGKDRIHPENTAHIVYGCRILEMLGEIPVVASLEIDGKTGVFSGEHCGVGDFRVKEDGIEFTLIPAASPLPVIPAVEKFYPMTVTLNRMPLRVTGLPPGTYRMRCENLSTGDFSSDRLAAGLNLAELNTPMAERLEETGKASAVIRKNERILRYLIHGKTLIRKYGGDLGDPASCREVVERKLSENPAKGTYAGYQAGILSDYRKNIDSEPQTIAQLEEARLALYRAARPVPFKISLIRLADYSN